MLDCCKELWASANCNTGAEEQKTSCREVKINLSSGKGTFANFHLLKTTNCRRNGKNLCRKRQDVWVVLKLDHQSEVVLTLFNIINIFQHQLQMDRMLIVLPIKTVFQAKFGTGKSLFTLHKDEFQSFSHQSLLNISTFLHGKHYQII